MIHLLVALLLVQVQDPPPKKDTPVDEVTITAPKAQAPVEPAPAAHKVDEKELELFDYDDPTSQVLLIPGITVRAEDGFGLRPNIGMRGTSPERSAKITLMEDGILFAPAPYAAPAAYYYPMATRIVGIDAYTGPSILRFGPLTTGGALDLRTRAIPRDPAGSADVALGSYGYGKAHVWAGGEEQIGVARAGFLIDGVYLTSDGFKELDGGGDTGFEKTEIMFKGAVSFGGTPDAPDHRLGLKLGYSWEESDETYLGLSDDDFDANPYRRYRGSQLDLMKWHRAQVEVTHETEIARGWHLASALYHHDFDRVWSKLNRFQGGPDLNVILADPTQVVNAVYYAVLTGAQDTSSSDEQLMIGTNDRRFMAQGIQSDVAWESLTPGGRIDRAFQAGVRLHRDEAVRYHTEDAYRMENGELIFNGSPELVTTDTTATAEALAVHAGYVHRVGDFLLAPRARVEYIRTRMEDHASGDSENDSSAILLPGFLATYEFSEAWSVKGGVYRGFSPKAPGQAEEIDPETSVVYELGGAFARRETQISATVFLNDYENLLAEDTFSGGGPGTGEQFNGGEVRVFGVEVDARQEIRLAPGLSIPLSADYTFQSSEFLTSFSSDNPQWGDVEEGDELPYLPGHQLTVTAGLAGETWDVSILVSTVSWMRETAGRGDPIRYEKVPARTVVDLSAAWRPFAGGRVYAKVLNLFDEEYLVSHRPFGARPGAPLQFQAGVELKF